MFGWTLNEYVFYLLLQVKHMKKYLFILLLFASCHEPKFDSICQENGAKRACTKDEQNMIDTMHRILRKVFAFDRSRLFTDFIQVSNSHNPKLLIFGEDHTATIGKIGTLGALNILARPGDTLYLEGADRNLKFDFDNCALFLIYRIFTGIEYQKAHAKYDAQEVLSFIAEKDFLKLYKNTRLSYNLSSTNLKYLRCKYWDDAEGLADYEPTPGNMKKRNGGMIGSFKRRLSQKGRVIVLTGYGHMPLGEVIKFPLSRMHVSFKAHVAEMESFYPKAKKERKLPCGKAMGITDSCAGSSRVLFKFLKTVPHTQYIHVRMLIRPNEDF